jgi:hypothetical protein
MDDTSTQFESTLASKLSRRKRYILAIGLPACLILAGLAWQAYEYIQDQSDRIK